MLMTQRVTVVLCVVLCVGDVDSRWTQSAGETGGTWSDPDLTGETESWKPPSVRHQQAAAQIQPGQPTGNQVGTHTHTHTHTLTWYVVRQLNTWIYIQRRAWMCVITSRDFSERNINLTLHTINEPWLYSVLWCSGVSSVSSEAPHILNKVPYPIWLMVSTHGHTVLAFFFIFARNFSGITLQSSFICK